MKTIDELIEQLWSNPVVKKDEFTICFNSMLGEWLVEILEVSQPFNGRTPQEALQKAVTYYEKK